MPVLYSKNYYFVRQHLPELYTGGFLSPAWPRLVARTPDAPEFTDWSVIVDLSGSSGVVSDAEVVRPYKYAQRILRWEVDDGVPLPMELFDAVWALWTTRRLGAKDGEPTPVLIQCAAGLSRSASVCAAILQRELGISHADASARVMSTYNDVQYPLPQPLASAGNWAANFRGELSQKD